MSRIVELEFKLSQEALIHFLNFLKAEGWNILNRQELLRENKPLYIQLVRGRDNMHLSLQYDNGGYQLRTDEDYNRYFPQTNSLLGDYVNWTVRQLTAADPTCQLTDISQDGDATVFTINQSYESYA